MEKQHALRQRLTTEKTALMARLNGIYDGSDTRSALLNTILNCLKMFIASTRKFLADDCFTKAASITYTIILSLVPALTMALSIYSIIAVGENKKELFDRILLFMAENNIKVNADPLFEVLLSLIDNAGRIGGISAVFMIFSATAMLRSMEKSFNDIWKVQKGRPLHLKIVYYSSALTLGPFLLASGMTIATLFSETFSSPNYRAGSVTDSRQLWIVGDKSTILATGTKKIDLSNVSVDSGKIDFDNQKIHKREPAAREFAEMEEMVEPAEFKKANFKDIQFIGGKGWIVGSDGIMLRTASGGASWQIMKFDSYRFNDIHMLNEQIGFIAADRGSLLTTRDGGTTWKVKEWEGQRAFSNVAFFRDNGIVTGTRGGVLQTYDRGMTWAYRHIPGAKRGNRFVNLNAAFFVNERTVWVLGNEGILLRSDDGGRTWVPKKFKVHDYYSAYFFSAEDGIIGGNKGVIIRTNDGGQTWDEERLPMLRVNSILPVDNAILAIGDAGTIMESQNSGRTWRTIKKGSTFGFTAINFIAPFFFIWLLFVPAYITLPNIKVPFRASALGAAVTSAVWVIFILLFIVYIKQFARGTFAIYGALAAIPLFLLLIYASTLIILYGAEIAYSFMYPETYRGLTRSLKRNKEMQVYNGIAILKTIYEKFEKGLGATSLNELQNRVSCPIHEITAHIFLFTNGRLVFQNADSDYIPANSSANLNVNDIIDLVTRVGFDLPNVDDKSAYRRFMTGLFNSITAGRRKAVGNITLHDLINKK